MSFLTFLEEKIPELLFQIFFLALITLLLLFYGADGFLILLLLILFVVMQLGFFWISYEKNENVLNTS